MKEKSQRWKAAEPILDRHDLDGEAGLDRVAGITDMAKRKLGRGRRGAVPREDDAGVLLMYKRECAEC